MKYKIERLKQFFIQYRGICALAFLLFHFLMIFIYVAPVNITGERLKNYTSYYMRPYFNQQWSLFAPAPVVEHEISIKIGEEQKWYSLNQFDHQKADQLFFTAHWRYSLGSYNLLYWVQNDLKYFEKRNGGIPPVIKERFWKKYFSNQLIKTYSKSQLKRLNIPYDKSKVFQVKCVFKNLKEKTTQSYIFQYESL